MSKMFLQILGPSEGIGVTAPRNPRKPVRLGITGVRVSERLREVREDVRPRMSLRHLEIELERIGHPISADGLSKIEIGKRKVDVDDLVALAVALRVSPVTLLLPATEANSDRVRLTERVEVHARNAWDWARVRGTNPYLTPTPTNERASWDARRSLPTWAVGVDGNELAAAEAAQILALSRPTRQPAPAAPSRRSAARSRR